MKLRTYQNNHKNSTITSTTYNFFTFYTRASCKQTQWQGKLEKISQTKLTVISSIFLLQSMTLKFTERIMTLRLSTLGDFS